MDLLGKFYNGCIAVLADKAKPKEIENFYSLIENDTQLKWPKWFGEWETMLGYLKSKTSGPYHFIIGRILNGSDHCPDSCEAWRIRDFLKNCSSIDINEEDIEKMFI